MSAQDELDVHLDVWLVADKYGVEQLKARCIKKIRAVILGRLGDSDLIWHVAERAATTVENTGELDSFVRNWLLLHLSLYQEDERLERYVKDNPAFGWEIIKRMRRVEDGGTRAYRVDVEDEYACHEQGSDLSGIVKA